MASKKVVEARIQLVSVNGTSGVWLDLMAFLASVGVNRVRGRLVLCEKDGNFRVRVGIQTYVSDPEAPDAPVTLGTGTGVGQISTVTKNLVDFDPNASDRGSVGRLGRARPSAKARGAGWERSRPGAPRTAVLPGAAGHGEPSLRPCPSDPCRR